jgi:hypothetical protein
LQYIGARLFNCVSWNLLVIRKTDERERRETRARLLRDGAGLLSSHLLSLKKKNECGSGVARQRAALLAAPVSRGARSLRKLL